ncbi:MAG: class I SAM-dependent methyltransferase [Gammaproteobacteria bacterium]
MRSFSTIFRKFIGSVSASCAREFQSTEQISGDNFAGATSLEEEFSFEGFNKGRVHTKFVENLSDDDLRYLNNLLPWKCFTVDSKGRRFGNRAWPGKRETPQPVPDPRIAELNRRYDLRDKHVLELGCFEGVHTIALCSFGARVTAIDSRIENVVKTVVRCAMFGYSPSVFVCDLEHANECERLPRVDVLHHVGVLYHLTDPVGHLRTLMPFANQGIMLDTHYAEDRDANDTYESDGRAFRYQRYREGGKAEVFSGMRDHAKWLRLDDMIALLTDLGFSDVDVVDRQVMRNGARVLMYAQRAR